MRIHHHHLYCRGVTHDLGDLRGRRSRGMGELDRRRRPLCGRLAHAFYDLSMVVGFSFQGTELMGIAAGESENPGKNIPKAAHQIFWRISFFISSPFW